MTQASGDAAAFRPSEVVLSKCTLTHLAIEAMEDGEAEPHVVSALKAKRAELVGEIELTTHQLQQLWAAAIGWRTIRLE